MHAHLTACLCKYVHVHVGSCHTSELHLIPDLSIFWHFMQSVMLKTQEGLSKRLASAVTVFTCDTYTYMQWLYSDVLHVQCLWKMVLHIIIPMNVFMIQCNYSSVPVKCQLPGKHPCTTFQGVTVAASIQTYGILIPGKRPCGPKLRVIFKRPWVLTRDTTVYRLEYLR